MLDGHGGGRGFVPVDAPRLRDRVQGVCAPSTIEVWLVLSFFGRAFRSSLFSNVCVSRKPERCKNTFLKKIIGPVSFLAVLNVKKLGEKKGIVAKNNLYFFVLQVVRQTSDGG